MAMITNSEFYYRCHALDTYMSNPWFKGNNKDEEHFLIRLHNLEIKLESVWDMEPTKEMIAELEYLENNRPMVPCPYRPY